MKKIAIMTCGGDCAGLNSVIKTVTLSAINRGVSVVGVLDGFIGFVEGRYIDLTVNMVQNIETIGGTILGSSNKENPSFYPSKEDKTILVDRIDEAIEKLKAIDVEALIVVGGDGSLSSAKNISERGLKVIGIPKTIDNDMSASNPTLGFETAIGTVVDAINKLRTTANSHRRVIVTEIMGRTSGYLTLYGGFVSGADIILLPEKDFDLDKVCNKVNKIIDSGKRYVIIAISEAAKEEGKEETIARIVTDSFEQKRYGGAALKLANQIEERTGHEARGVVLGHLQRGGNPCPTDIIIGSQLGEAALNLLIEGHSGYIVGVEENMVKKTKFPEKIVPRLLDFEKDTLIETAKNIGIYFGD